MMPTNDDDDPSLGYILLRIAQATPSQLESLRGIIESNPGSFRMMVQFGDANSAPIRELRHRVSGSNEFLGAVRRCVTRAELDVHQKAEDLVPVSDAPSPRDDSAHAVA